MPPSDGQCASSMRSEPDCLSPRAFNHPALYYLIICPISPCPHFIFLGSKITVDSDYRNEIKRCLLLGRKAMINPDSTLKSKDITLLTKICLVKVMVFLVVMYGCESWTTKKAEG